MPKASDYSNNEFVKLIMIGNSGSGKTGALLSLVKAGYKLKVVDFDKGLDALVNFVRAECPDKLENIEYITFRDPIKMTQAGPKVIGAPKAYVNAMNALETWPEDGSTPAEWGRDTILVVDSLTNAGRAAMKWAMAAAPTAKDGRQWYKVAQDLIEDLIANLTSDEFKTNVIVISHIELGDSATGVKKGFVSAVGKALGPKIPRFFNTLIVSETSGVGKKKKHELKTLPTAMIDAKNPAPMKIEESYDINGLAKIFEALGDL